MRLWKAVVALGIVALVTAPVLAQGRGRGGFGPQRIDQLATNKSVQDELKIDKDQATKVEETLKKVRDDLKDDYAKLGGRGGGNQATPEERAAATKKVNEAVEKALKDVLKDDQQKRLAQIYHQQQGLAMFQDESVQKALKLTDEQKSKIKEINDDLNKQRAELFPQGQKPEADAITKFTNLRKEALSNATKALDDGQKKTLKELTGEPFEIKFERGGKPNKPQTDF